MALGHNLRKARESRKLTASQVAVATHMKVQTVEAIEQEDFSGMPAAIYCKGFIKLYAEYMGMDPDPLTREYVERFVEPPPPPEPEEPEEAPGVFNMSFNKKEDIPAIAQEDEEDEKHPDLFAYGANRTEQPPEKLFEHTAPEQGEEAEPESTGDEGPTVLTKIADSISGLFNKLKEKSSQLANAIPDREPEILQPAEQPAPPAVDTSPITLPNRQILIISGAIVGVILMIFLVSVIARFVTRDGDTTELDPSEQEIILPVQPPPPYID